MDFYKLYLSTYYLIELDCIKKEQAIANFIELIRLVSSVEDIEKILYSYHDFILSLKGRSISYYIKKALAHKFVDVNSFEYNLVLSLSQVKYEDLKNIILDKFSIYSDLINNLPYFNTDNLDLSENNTLICDEDKYKNSRAFIYTDDLEIMPVNYIETIKYSDLKGYDYQKNVLYNNTKALLNGSKVNNILLYGDAGCGKSTSVRALLNEFDDIKIVQIFKNNLIHLGQLYSLLAELPFKFIIFADDISFDEQDVNLSTMKAMLDGSIIQCPQNAVIYATSNRRHLVKESFASRSGDEIHLNDTINEVSSLSERFGINLLFSRPSNDEFVDIVVKLAQDNNITMNENELLAKAQRLALIKGTKSPRVARQLIDNILAGIEM